MKNLVFFFLLIIISFSQNLTAQEKESSYAIDYYNSKMNEHITKYRQYRNKGIALTTLGIAMLTTGKILYDKGNIGYRYSNYLAPSGQVELPKSKVRNKTYGVYLLTIGSLTTLAGIPVTILGFVGTKRYKNKLVFTFTGNGGNLAYSF